MVKLVPVVTYCFCPFTYISYRTTPTSSVDGLQLTEMELRVVPVIARLCGAAGGCVSVCVVPLASLDGAAAPALVTALTLKKYFVFGLRPFTVKVRTSRFDKPAKLYGPPV